MKTSGTGLKLLKAEHRIVNTKNVVLLSIYDVPKDESTKKYVPANLSIYKAIEGKSIHNRPLPFHDSINSVIESTLHCVVN